jgi:hypothetical protein
MKSTKWMPVIALIVLAFSCAYAQDVHYNYDRGANFAAYKTYQWVDEPTGQAKVAAPSGLPRIDLPGGGPLAVRGGTPDDQLIRQDIQRAAEEQLAQKGLTKVESNADLLVTYHAAIREEQSINLSAFGTGSAPWAGWGGGWGGLESGTVTGQTSTIPIGTLVVDLYDPARKQLVWRGGATKTIDVKKDPDKNYRNLQKAMAKLFRNYPPQAK